MGRIEKEGDHYVYRQNDGRISAWFIDFKEHMVLSHDSDPVYRKVFFWLVAVGFAYLVYIFYAY
jgi:hypothetical protein